jgi:hypothetical protein
VRPGPLPSHQLPMPAKEGLRSDEERAPRLSPKGPARSGEERLVGCAVDRALHLAAEDCDLVTQHGDLKLRLGRDALVGPEQAEDTAQEEVEDGPDHGAALSQIGSPPQPSGGDRVSGPHGFDCAFDARCGRLIEYLYPTGS